MDSKYNAISNQLSSNPYIFKRKPTNGHTMVNIDQSKRFKFGNTSSNNVVRNNSPNGQNSNGRGLSIEEQRQQLPVCKVRKQLLQKIVSSKTLIIIGETGCGKSTQIPQMIYETSKSEFGLIAVTQPRRIAAITLSKRVALEQKCNIGETVGYAVRFEDVSSTKTKIKYMTDGTLLREALQDRYLRKYRVIILDEAHERSINTDILFGIVKEAQRSRSDKKFTSLKIIIMSATIDVDHFSKYFNNCEPIYLDGRTYPVQVFHSAVPQPDYVNASLITFFQIHKDAPVNHDVLIFLTGQEEIENLAAQIRAIARSNELGGPNIRVYPLYAQLNQNKQLEVFQPSSNNFRKVVLSTNIAETSLTIKGIRYVIDSGMVKRKVYDSTTGMGTLRVSRISQDQAWQRTGRAGRESAGVCYRTYTMNEYRTMPSASVPEILRSNIAATMLQLLALQIDCQVFDYLDKPSDRDIENALKELHQLGAINRTENPELTEIGWNMSKFPLHPRFSKMIMSSLHFGCLDEMLTIVSILSGETIFYLSDDPEKRVEALRAHARFASIHGDHLTLLNVYNEFKRSDRHRMFCHDNFLQCRNLEYARDVRAQLSSICERLNLESSTCGTNVDQVRKCLITGLYNNIAEKQRDHTFITISSRQSTRIHPSSVLHNKSNLKCVLFTEMVHTSMNFMRIVTNIEPQWIDEVVPNAGLSNRLSHSYSSFNGNGHQYKFN